MSTTRSAERPAATVADWVVCGGCRILVYRKRLGRSLDVCPECSWHHPVAASTRIAQLLDPGSVHRVDGDVRADFDPLGFVDSMPYRQRVSAARERTGLDEAVVCVRGSIGGQPLVAAVMDFRFLGGSLGSAVGERITAAAELALRENIPLLIVTASGGARMQEGALSLMQMAKTSQALGRLDEAGLATVAVITDPTYGGVAASFATLCDVVLAEPGARLGFAGRRVIEQTIRESLPPDFQTVEFLFRRGFIDDVVPRSELRPTLIRLLGMIAARPRPTGPARPDPLIRDPEELPERAAWESVQAARNIARPTFLDYARLAFDDFTELHGDRVADDCPALIGGIARLAGRPVMLLGHQKGHVVAELAHRNYGMASPAGYRKAARLMRLAAKLGLPVVTLIDTPGAYPGRAAEEQGQAYVIAECIRLMSGLPVPVVAVVTGEGGSGGALAIATANRVLMFADAVYSVISAEGCAAILWQNPSAAPAAAAALRLGAADLLRLGIADGVIPEPDGGCAADPVAAADTLRSAVAARIEELTMYSGEQLRDQRYDRFRRFGREAVRQTAPSGALIDDEGI